MNHTTLRIALVACGLAVAGCRSRPTENTPPPAPPRDTRAAVPSTGPHDGAATPPTPAAASDVDPPATPAEFREAARYLPQGRVGDWVQSGSVTRSTAANLFQVIDGAAVAYERYGVRSFARTDYRRPGTTLVATVEVYEFAAPIGAFGRYSMMLSDGRDPASLQLQGVQRGGGGYQGTTQTTFWKGSVLAQISVTDTSDEPSEQAIATAAREVLPRLAEAVERIVPGQVAPPLSPLPSDNMVWGGNTYFAEGVYGVEQTGAAWIGHYRSNEGKRYRLAVFTRASVGDAQAVLARFRPLGGHPVAGLGDEALAVTSPSAGEIVVARRGTNVFAAADGGITGQPSPTREAKIAILRAAMTATIAALPADGTAPTAQTTTAGAPDAR
ncbi:MAG: DUF6599 family protein [Deltaproteobacteria bacterium]